MSVNSLPEVSVHPSVTLELNSPIRNEVGFIDSLKQESSVSRVHKVGHLTWTVVCTPNTSPESLDELGLLARKQVPSFQ